MKDFITRNPGASMRHDFPPATLRLKEGGGHKSTLRRRAVLPGPWSVLLTGLLLLWGGWGCGGSLTAGGFAELEVVVTGDAGQAAAAVPGRALGGETRTPGHPGGGGEPGRTPRVTAFDDDDNGPEGEIELEFLLFLRRPDGSEFQITREEIEVEVDLGGSFEADALRTEIPAERFTALRIVFTEIEVEIESGVIINGVPLTGPIDVELGDDERIEVVRPLLLDPRDGDRVAILLDINAGSWLQSIDPDLRRLAERFFADAISVVVR